LTSAWAWHHTGLSVDDLSKALKFYQSSFGFTPVFEAMDMSDLIENLTGVKGLRADLVQCKSRNCGSREKRWKAIWLDNRIL